MEEENTLAMVAYLAFLGIDWDDLEWHSTTALEEEKDTVCMHAHTQVDLANPYADTEVQHG